MLILRKLFNVFTSGVAVYCALQWFGSQNILYEYAAIALGAFSVANIIMTR